MTSKPMWKGDKGPLVACEDDEMNNLALEKEYRASNARKMLVSHLPFHPPVSLEFSDLRYSVRDVASSKGSSSFGSNISKQMKYILKDVSGVFKPGQLTAIMGPSGAGKSTLMNILAGYKTHNIQGTVNVNGKRRDLAQFRKMACYIMQDDVLLPHLTVLEAMRYAAQLKLPRRTSKERRELVVTEILDMIGLSECKNVRTSNISGGQRKRLAIALELVNNPELMFFDEPTSGLDSASCYSCVALLKALAMGGRTIIATIHQPSARIFEQFDALYLLSGGMCLYRGPVSSLVPFMAKQGLHCPAYHNPADFAIEVASGDYGDHWISMLKKATALSSESDSGLANDISDAEDSHHQVENSSLSAYQKDNKGLDRIGSSKDKDVSVALMSPDGDSEETISSDDGRVYKFCNQFTVLLKRSFLCIYRDLMLTHLRFASTVLVGLLIGAIFHDSGNNADQTFNNAGNIFFGLLFMVFSAMMSTVLTFPLERGVLVREHLNCWYSLKSYYLARTLADMPFQLFFPLLYTVITYFMTDQPHEAFRFWIIVAMNTMISLVAQSLGLLIGAACHIQSAVFVAPITAIPVFLFGGFFVTLSSVPAYLRWMSYGSYAKYAFQSAITAVYGFDRADLKCHQPYCHFKNPRKFLEQLDCKDVDVMEQTLCLFALVLLCRVLAYFALRLKIFVEKQ
ncbi:ATP-binding cassette sub-family G member 4 isoform X2 [Folsomia candida]|uniref:ATP-binding cassette sub-family G member 4 isoform X2 n=1 Tax=Folsomia candida TaxID=158441 RepID=UPI001605105A|nr:ATP-binding cassette sub-family G member 4 isoform X2 [Folsomia candida]